MFSLDTMDPKFTNIFLLHSKIRSSKPAKIQELFSSFTTSVKKQMLLTFLQFFMRSDNKAKYVDTEGPEQSANQAIIDACTQQFTAFGNSQPCIIDALPTLLLSQCISFLEQKDRIKASRVDTVFLKAASESMAKAHLAITFSFIKNHMYKSHDHFNKANNYHSLSTLHTWKVAHCRKVNKQ